MTEYADKKNKSLGWLQKIHFVKNPLLIPLLILTIIVFCTIFAPYLTTYPPNKAELRNQFIPPTWMAGGDTKYLLGTDYFGRDIVSRLIYGARISLSIALITIAFSAFFGTLIGLTSGYFGGKADVVLMRLIDGWLAFPTILICILFAVVFGPSYRNVIIILTLAYWPRYARQIRGESLAIKEQDYVTMAKVNGCSSCKIMIRHIFPNVLPTLLVMITFFVGEVILMEAMLSFLGVGVPPPTASWGSMVAAGQDYIRERWWISAFPGIVIFMTVLSINLIGDWLRDHFDPKLRQL